MREKTEINCINCKNFLMIGICKYSDICKDFDHFIEKFDVKKYD